VLGAVAELERNITHERVTAGLQRAKKEGRTLGRPRVIVDRVKVRQLHRRDGSVSVLQYAVLRTGTNETQGSGFFGGPNPRDPPAPSCWTKMTHATPGLQVWVCGVPPGKNMYEPGPIS